MTDVSKIPAGDMKRLRAYARQVDWLRKSKLLSSGKVSFKFNTTHSFTTGDTKLTFEGYDETHFLAVLPVLRQFILEGEPVSLFGIHNVILKHCDREDLTAWVKLARKQWGETLNSLPSDRLMFFNGSGPVKKAIGDVFYGYAGLFHVDVDRPDVDQQTQVLLNAGLQKAMPRLLNSIFNSDSIIHFWLDEPTKPVPACPSIAKGEQECQ